MKILVSLVQRLLCGCCVLYEGHAEFFFFFVDSHTLLSVEVCWNLSPMAHLSSSAPSQAPRLPYLHICSGFQWPPLVLYTWEPVDSGARKYQIQLITTKLFLNVSTSKWFATQYLIRICAARPLLKLALNELITNHGVTLRIGRFWEDDHFEWMAAYLAKPGEGKRPCKFFAAASHSTEGAPINA